MARQVFEQAYKRVFSHLNLLPEMFLFLCVKQTASSLAGQSVSYGRVFLLHIGIFLPRVFKVASLFKARFVQR